MASWFGSFAAGFSKGIVEQIAEKEKEQAAMTAASIKNMYHNVQEKKKEIAKQMKATFARIAWNDEGLYRVINQSDPTYLKAIYLFQ